MIIKGLQVLLSITVLSPLIKLTGFNQSHANRFITGITCHGPLERLSLGSPESILVDGSEIRLTTWDGAKTL